jgi:hypothetical protein
MRLRGLLLLQLLLLRLLLVGTVMPDGAADGCAGQAMMARDVARDTAHGGALEAALGIGGAAEAGQRHDGAKSESSGFHESLRELLHCNQYAA